MRREFHINFHLVDNILHSSVKGNVVQRMGLVNHHVTLRAVDVVLQMFNNAALAEGVETLGHCGGINLKTKD